MTTINSLSQIDALGGGDQVPVYDSDAGTARKASVSQFVAYFRSAFASPDVAVTISSPIAGFNQVLATSATSIWLILTPAGTLATGTVTLPPVADCFDGQQVLVTSTESITALTVAGNGATVNGAPAALGIDGFFALRFNKLLSSWFCVSQSLGALGTSFTDITVTNAILDANGNEILAVTPASALAVNHVLIANTATGDPPGILVEGTDASIGLRFETKGGGALFLQTGAGNIVLSTSGNAVLNGDVLATLTASQTLTSKTLTGPITDAIKTGGVATSTVALVNLAYPPATSRGFRTVVIDASTTLILGLGTTVSGGGANVAPVYCDGVTWKYG